MNDLTVGLPNAMPTSSLLESDPEVERLLALSASVDQHYSMPEPKKRILLKYLLANRSKGMSILELGVCHGATAIMLLDVANSVHGYYEGVDHFKLEGSYQAVVKLLGVGVFGSSYSIFNQSTQEFASTTMTVLQDWDFMVIDAGHDEVNVKHDVERILPKLKPDGVVVFDDYDGPEGAHEAVYLHANQATEGWKVLHSGDGLLIARKPL